MDRSNKNIQTKTEGEQMKESILRDADGQIIITADLLRDLRAVVTAGTISENQLKTLSKSRCGGVLGRKLREYLYLGNPEALDMDEKEVFSTLVYKMGVDEGAPVFHKGECIPAPGLGEQSIIDPIYIRKWIPGLLVLHWKDDRTERIDGYETVKHLAKREFEWNDRFYQLVADSPKKTFYFESSKVPAWIHPWIQSCLPQHKADLQVLLKRPGYTVQSLNGYRLEVKNLRSRITNLWDQSDLDVYSEQGALVLSNNRYWKLANELGVHTVTGFQGTLLFENGTYFKGAILPEILGLESGIYGGIKWSPGNKHVESEVILASIMNSFAHYPWKPSMNRQQSDYAENWDELPIRAKQFDPEMIQMALTGFPAYVKRFSYFLTSAVGNLFKKIQVEGFAGQVALGATNHPDVQFQVYLNPKKHHKFCDQHGKIIQAAWLPNPSLPINVDIARINIQIILSEQVYDQLVVLNMADSNLEFVGNIYMAVGQDDGDGDGSTLDIETEHLAKAVPWQQVRFHNTLQYKAKEDVPSVDAETAIDVAFTRSLKAHDIGRGDKLMRRIIREYPNNVTGELQTAVTKYNQMTISSQKKYVGDIDQVWGEIWHHLPVDIRSDLRKKMEEGTTKHDQIDSLKANATSLINAHMDLVRSREKNLHVLEQKLNDAEKGFSDALDAAREAMPGHYSVAQQLLALHQDVNPEIYGRIRRKGEELMIIALRRGLSIEHSQLVEQKFRFIHQIWKQAGKTENEENRGMNYDEAAELIKQLLTDLIVEVGPEMVYGAMLVGPVRFTDGMLGRTIKVRDLEYLDRLVPTFRLLNGIYIPVSVTGKQIQIDGFVTKKDLINLVAYPVLLGGLKDDVTYQIKAVRPYRAAEWLSGINQSTRFSLALLHLIEQ